VFLFDEPLSNLDASLRLTMRNELIRQQAELGTTTIYVTHDQVEAMTMGHRLCIMNQGEIVQIGRPLEVYRNPINTFAARFLGSPQMNLLKAGISRDDGQYTVNLAGTVVRIPGGSPAAATGHKESSILVGIRPEDLYDVQPAMPAERLLQIQTRVLAVEPLGPETILLLMVEVTHEELIARVGRETPIRRGEQVTIFGDTFALHWFDPVTSNAIDLRSCQSAGQINLQEHS
jgi:multiple sugar transport system ATP-binding protein